MAECRQFERIVVSTSQVDPGVTGIGSSPSAGDFNYTGIVLPNDVTPDRTRRYLCRLCGVRVNTNARVILRSIRQLLTLYDEVDSEEEGVTFPYELAVTSPVWRFVDGNVSWHLRAVNPKLLEGGPRVFNDVPPMIIPFTASQDGSTATILSRDATAGLYRPLNGAEPYGEPVAGLGTFYDLRYPWSQSTEPASLDIEVAGPIDLIMYASVFQTDPETRPTPAVAPNLLALGPEDRFVTTFPTARYHRIGAEMVVDLCNPLPR